MGAIDHRGARKIDSKPVARLGGVAVVIAIAAVLARGAGAGVFEADRHHIHHRLLELGHRHDRAVLLLYAAVVVLDLPAFASVFMMHRDAALLLGVIVIAAAIGITKLSLDGFATREPRGSSLS